MAMQRVGHYHARRIVRFSTPKKSPDISSAQTPVLRPWRDAVFAGLCVAAAISLGAYAVYARACSEKTADVRRHIVQLCKKLSQPTGGVCCKFTRKPEDAARGNAVLVFARDNSDEARRIYGFSFDDDPRTILDTGRAGEGAAPRPLPAEALLAREYFRERRRPIEEDFWMRTRGREATAFAIVHNGAHRAVGILGVEADTDRLLVRLAAIRDAFLLTCLLGLAAGGVAGLVVWRLQARAAATHRKLAEKHLMEEAIIASLGEVVYTFDPVEKRFQWRGETAPLLGCAPTGAALAEWTARIHPDDRQRYELALSQSLETLRPLHLEYRLARAEGGVRWILDRSQPVRLHDGHAHLIGSLSDITDPRAAEETLRLFFDETATAHLVFHGDVLLDANPAALALFGAERKETLIARPVWSLWPRRQPTNALSVEGWAGRVLEAMESGRRRFEWQFARLDGSLIDCDVFLRQAVLQERPVLVMTCTDITPMKQAQAQLIVSEQRFRDVSEAVGEFIWEVDRELRYLYASPRVKEVLGLEPAEALGRHTYDFVPEEDRDAVRERSEVICHLGMPFRNFEHRVRRADGSLLWVSVSGVPNYDASGKIAGYRGASLDITKHRAYEQELVLQKEAAEAADRAKSNFLAMMSHEIRTPLNSVLGFADLVLDTQLDAVQRDYLETIKRSGDALLVLLNDILDFSKIESGRMEVDIRATDLPRCIREVLDLHQLNATAKKIRLVCDIAPDLPRYALTDGSRLRQILLNLVGNAVKFTNRGEIRVSASLKPDEAGARIHIVVSDTGIGISPLQRERLFKPFTQADSSTTRRFGGTGLGLAISKRLAKLLGGDLALLDRDGPGAAFRVELPANLPGAQDSEKSAAKPEPDLFSLDPSARFGGRVPRVLVVDDNTLNRRLTTQLLHQLGAETAMAASAEECFEKLTEAEFDLVLMDVQMPGMDGLDATLHLRAQNRWRNQRIVALTADAMVGDRERCLAAGMDDYLTKPLRREELARVVRESMRPREV
jgi:PAS domain S-box-containing protein